MKTLFIAFSFFISTIAFSQNIINTLGSGGLYSIKDASGNYLTLSQSTGQINILKTLRLENTSGSTVGVIFKGTDRIFHNYGFANLFLGINSGNFSMTGTFNTAMGYQSLMVNTTGSENTAMGLNSLASNTTGSFNTAIGLEALYLNVTGTENTAIGWRSSNNSTGDYNTSVGSGTLFSNKGSHNTAIGSRTMFQNTTGNENTAVGRNSLYLNTTGNSNTSIGMLTLQNNLTGSQNTAVGHHSLQNNTGNYNTAVGYNSGSSVTTGANITCIGIDANPSSGTVNDQITLGNVFVNSLRCNVQTITSLSDARDKKIIKDLSLGLDFLMKLKPRQFNWDKREWYGNNISDGSKMKESPTAGFIAQELDEVQTNENAEWLNLVLKDNPEKFEATYGNLLPVMVKAIQELEVESEKLKVESEKLKVSERNLLTENAKLNDENLKMKQRLSNLEHTQNLLIREFDKLKLKEKNLTEINSGDLK